MDRFLHLVTPFKPAGKEGAKDARSPAPPHSLNGAAERVVEWIPHSHALLARLMARLVAVSPASTVSATATAAPAVTTAAATGTLFARPSDIDVKGAPA